MASTARTLFEAKGWAQTTIRGVAREARVSVPTVYAVYAVYESQEGPGRRLQAEDQG
ncbi:TetR family transcriptional regulator [Microbispora sp. NPDC049125]|uniref:TetR family transcriptional regulator n=1 Tax=Microbispora sp. NPDC049125 TaxID=3154929 RepID=UPI00346671F8